MNDKASAVADLATIARQTVVSPERRTRIDADQPLPTEAAADGGVPRLELYHAPFSICSNKVRMVLAEQGDQWLSHEVDITAPRQENYNPDYVRLRLASDVARKTTLSRGFSGGSSVADSGFDAMVVPTLVDNASEQVFADSKLICLYLCREIGSTNLLPGDMEEAILAEVEAIDRTPHVALLYGVNPDGDCRPAVFQQAMADVHAHKLAALEAARSRVAGDEALVTAYDAKIEKQRSAEAFTGTPEKMRAAIEETRGLIEGLDAKLRESGGPWIFGGRYTLADAMWIVSLFRLEYLGYGTLWRGTADRVDVTRYTDAGYDREACRTAVRHWPGTPPSQWVATLMPGNGPISAGS